MNQTLLREIADQLQHERRALVREVNEADDVFTRSGAMRPL